MMRDPFDIVPAIHRESPRSALVTAFGSATIGAIAPVTGRASGAHIFRIGSRSTIIDACRSFMIEMPRTVPIAGRRIAPEIFHSLDQDF